MPTVGPRPHAGRRRRFSFWIDHCLKFLDQEGVGSADAMARARDVSISRNGHVASPLADDRLATFGEGATRARRPAAQPLRRPAAFRTGSAATKPLSDRRRSTAAAAPSAKGQSDQSHGGRQHRCRFRHGDEQVPVDELFEPVGLDAHPAVDRVEARRIKGPGGGYSRVILRCREVIIDFWGS